MLPLFSNPRVGLSLALETGISAGEGADLIDIDGKRAVRFRDGPIISHASDMVCSRAPANRRQAQRSRVTIKLIHCQTAAAALCHRTDRPQHHGLRRTVGDMALARAEDGAWLHDRHDDAERAVRAVHNRTLLSCPFVGVAMA